MHECKYAEHIGKEIYYIKREDGVEVCGFCHVPKEKAVAPKATAKTVGK